MLWPKYITQRTFVKTFFYHTMFLLLFITGVFASGVFADFKKSFLYVLFLSYNFISFNFCWSTRVLLLIAGVFCKWCRRRSRARIMFQFVYNHKHTIWPNAILLLLIAGVFASGVGADLERLAAKLTPDTTSLIYCLLYPPHTHT